MAKGLLRRTLELFQYFLGVGLWECNCEEDRAPNPGPAPHSHTCTGQGTGTAWEN